MVHSQYIVSEVPDVNTYYYCDGDFDHLVEEVSTRFLHHRVASFYFLIGKCLGRAPLKLCK